MARSRSRSPSWSRRRRSDRSHSRSRNRKDRSSSRSRRDRSSSRSRRDRKRDARSRSRSRSRRRSISPERKSSTSAADLAAKYVPSLTIHNFLPECFLVSMLLSLHRHDKACQQVGQVLSKDMQLIIFQGGIWCSHISVAGLRMIKSEFTGKGLLWARNAECFGRKLR